MCTYESLTIKQVNNPLQKSWKQIHSGVSTAFNTLNMLLWIQNFKSKRCQAGKCFYICHFSEIVKGLMTHQPRAIRSAMEEAWCIQGPSVFCVSSLHNLSSQQSSKAIRTMWLKIVLSGEDRLCLLMSLTRRIQMNLSLPAEERKHVVKHYL